MVAAARTSSGARTAQLRDALVLLIDDDTPRHAADWDRHDRLAPAHPFAGAQVGIDEAAPLVRILNTDFALDRITVKSPAGVAPAIQQAADPGTHFFLVDIPIGILPTTRGGDA